MISRDLIALLAFSLIAPARDLSAATVAIESPATHARESAPKRTGAFKLRFDSPPGVPVQVNYSLSGSAAANVHYVVRGAGLTGVGVSASARTAVVQIDPYNDSDTFDRTVTLTLLAGTGYTIGSPSAVTMTIVSDEQPATPPPVTPPPVPSAPAGLLALAAGSSAIGLSWSNTATNATAIVVEQSLISSSSGFVVVATLGTNATTHTVAGLTANTAHHYRIKARGDSGDSAYTATSSATTSAIAVPAAPTSLIATPASATRIDLAWTVNATDASSQRLEYSVTSTNGAFMTLATLAANAVSYAHTNLQENQTLHYRVYAVNLGGDSIASNFASATTLRTAPAAPTGLSAVTQSTTTIQIGRAHV